MSWCNRQRKYERGEKVSTFKEIVDAAARGDWIFIHHKPQHPSIVMCMSLGTISGMIARGALRHAVRNQSHPYVFKAENFGTEIGWFATCSEIPGVEIREFTRDAVIREAHATVSRHILFRSARVEIVFISEKHIGEILRAKELLP